MAINPDLDRALAKLRLSMLAACALSAIAFQLALIALIAWHNETLSINLFLLVPAMLVAAILLQFSFLAGRSREHSRAWRRAGWGAGVVFALAEVLAGFAVHEPMGGIFGGVAILIPIGLDIVAN